MKKKSSALRYKTKFILEELEPRKLFSGGAEGIIAPQNIPVVSVNFHADVHPAPPAPSINLAPIPAVGVSSEGNAAAQKNDIGLSNQSVPVIAEPKVDTNQSANSTGVKQLAANSNESPFAAIKILGGVNHHAESAIESLKFNSGTGKTQSSPDHLAVHPDFQNPVDALVANTPNRDVLASTKSGLTASSLEPSHLTGLVQTEIKREVVFVDTEVKDYGQIINGIKESSNADRQIDIVVLDGEKNGITQITETLSHYLNLDAVHLITHGSDGSIDFGSNQLNLQTLSQNQAQIQSWGDAFSANGDFLIYGCNVAQTQFGQSFVDYLSGLTGTDMAASNDATGHTTLGADWNLEYRSGAIEVENAVSAITQSQWTEVLAVTSNGTVTSAQGTNVTSLSWTHTVASGSNHALFVQLSIDAVGVNVNSVTYGGVSLTKVGRTAGNHAVEIWVLINPTVATNASIVASFSGNTNVAGGASTFNGVNQSTPTGTYAGATSQSSGDSTTSSVTVSSAVGDLVIDAQYWKVTGGNPAGTNQTTQWSQTISSGSTMLGASTKEAGAASVIMSGTAPSASQWEIGAVSVKAAAATAGITVTPTSGLTTTEAGGTAQFSVVLDTPPTANVTIPVSTSDATEGTVSTSSLTFTTANWNTPQTVTVTGVDDALADGFQAYSIVLGAVTSSDSSYNGLNPTDVQVATTDNDINYGKITVTTASDTADGDTSSLTALAANRGSDGLISLREAIQAANNTANGSGGADVINFNISGTGIHTINVGSVAGSLTITDTVNIDATTDDSFAANSNRPAIVLNGGNAVVEGLLLNGSASGGSAIRGFAIQNFTSNGINIVTSDNNTIAGNYIGTDTTGNAAVGNNNGINLFDAQNNLIGGTTATDRNIISGNTNIGVVITGTSTNNTFQGNYIGLGANGTTDLGNRWYGIYSQSTNNIIGGAVSGAGNVISGTGTSGGSANGIYLTSTASGTNLQGNIIGLNAAGTGIVANDGYGITVLSANNTIGGTSSFSRNVISGNLNDGIRLTGSSATGNSVLGNYIGTSITGLVDLGNGNNGVLLINGAQNNTIGDLTTAGRNIISGNTNAGVAIDNITTTGNVVIGNYIGLGVDGSTSLGNTDDGVHFNTAGANTVGSTNVSGRNVISSNGINGIGVADTSGVTIVGNYIGTDATGLVNKGNGSAGVQFSSTVTVTSGTVGGTASGAGNLISFNTGDGVFVNSATISGISILGNSIASNSGLGIDLGTNGVTANDLNDPDTGANSLQNFPVLTSATSANAGTTIVGSLNSVASKAYRIEFYANRPSIADSPNGEGERYLGYYDIAASGANTTNFTAVLSNVWVNASDKITATATVNNGGSSYGSTSEFAANINATSNGIVVVDTASDVFDGTTTTISTLGATRGADGRVSLREALTATKNTLNGASADKIVFNIAGTGIHTITLTYDGADVGTAVDLLPSITETLIIDATTDDSFAANGNNPAIALNGNGAVQDGLQIYNAGSGGSTVRGLVIQNFTQDGIDIASSNGNTIVGNFIGTNSAGNAAAGNQQGINIFAANNNIIGGTTAADRNVMSGNGGVGVYIGGGSTGNVLQGNYVGLNASGSGAVANSFSGIYIQSANSNTIGGTASGAGNIISGNGTTGLYIETSSGMTVLGNTIGLNALGNAAVANLVNGIYATDSTGLTIGGATVASRNIISGNSQRGIHFNNTDNSVIYGNYVGINAAGTGDVNGTAGNTLQSGLILDNGSSGNQVGNTAVSGARNVFSGNNHYGVEILISTSVNNTISGNYIGTDYTGLTALGNTNGGMSFWGAGTGNLVYGNVISGNLGHGVMVGNVADSAKIQGNYIGVGMDGSTLLGNGGRGISVEGASTNTLIGTDADGSNDAAEVNIISGNDNGIVVSDAGTTGTMIYGNTIGTDASGMLDRGNTFDGIRVENGATATLIGGAGTARRNIISGNNQDGIQIDGETSDGNTIQNNWIGLASDGVTVLGNSGDGIFINGGADNTIIGGINLGNVIMGSGLVGIEVDGVSTGTVIYGNNIGTNVAGTVVLGSQQNGILLESGASNTAIGGTLTGQGNVITDSGLGGAFTAGIDVNPSAGTGNTVIGNSIYGNQGIGIDLGVDGVTANDNLDPDTGGNNLQNFPVITSATTSGTGTVKVSGTLNTLANLTGVVIQLYATPSAGNPTGRQGKRYLGSTTVSTDASGNATFTNVTLSATVAAGEILTATATYANSTSEFSQGVTITSPNIAASDLYSFNGLSESSLIGVYGFNNVSNLGRDDAGNNAPITLFGTPGQTITPSGSGALDLAGGASGQYGDIVGITTGGAMTFAASVRFDSTGDWQRVFDFGQSGATGLGNIYVSRLGNSSDLTFTIEIDSGSGLTSYRAIATNVITNGAWLHFTATVDASGTMKLYINGSLAPNIEATKTGVAPDTGIRTNNYIGKSAFTAGDALFDGAIDNFVVANGAMSAANVMALYQQTTGFTVAENSPNGTVVGTVVGLDVDASANPTYSLTDSAGGRFAINSANGTITVANSTLLDYESAISHSITVQVSDTGGANYTETFTVNLTNVVEVTSATNLSASETYTEDTPLNLTDIVITRGDSNTVTATLTLSNTSAGSLNTGTSGAVTSTYNAGTGVWTASGAVADVNSLLAGLTFTPATNFNSNFTIATSINDGTATLTGTKSFTGTAINDAPTATNLSAAETYTEDTVLNLTDIVISDVDSANVTATLTLSNAAAGSLNIATSGAVTSTYNAATGVWTASGALADVNVLLAGLTFTPASNFNSSFTIATSVNDGVAPATTGIKTITGVATNDAPVATGSATLASVPEDTVSPGGATVSTLFSSNFTDPTDAGDSAHDQFAGVAVRGQSVNAAQGRWEYSINNGSTWNTFGALSDTNAKGLAASDLLRFLPTADYNGTPTNLSVRLIDNSVPITSGGAINCSTNGGTTAFSSSIVSLGTSISAVNDAPVNTLTGDGAVVPEDSVVQLLNSLAISDPDAGTGSFTVTLTVSSAAGTMAATSGSGVTISGSGTNTLVLNGTLSSINNYFTSAGTAPIFTAIADYNGLVSFTVVTNDNGNTGIGGALTDTASINGSISAVADIANDSVTTSEDTPITFSPLSNDTFENAGRTISHINGTSILSGGTITITGGNITLNADGTLTYAPTSNYFGTPSFTYTVTSGGATETATVNITVSAVNDAPTGSVTISGTPAQGQTLTASNTLADLDGLGTISYTWKADGNVVGTGATYTLTQAEVGKAITATASYTDGQGTNEAVASAPTAAVANVNDAPTGSVTISGTPAQGQTLTASNTLADLDGLGTISYTWKADGNVVGTGATYTLTQAEVGKAITATASYTDGQGTNEAVASAPTAAVANVNDAPTGSVTISGTPAQGQTLTASNTLADLDGLGTISYTWKADGNVVGTGATYTLTQAEVGKAITATASYTDGQGTNEAVASAPTAAVANVNDAPTGSVTISGTPAQGQTLTASNTLADLDGLGTISYTWKADGNVVGTGATYTLTQAEVGKAITATASYTDGQGTNEAVASAPTAAVANVNDAPTGSVTISGTPAQGQTLTASNTLADLDGLGTISYTWKADGNVVGTGATYTLTQAEVGKAITATASYTDGQGTNEAVASAPTAAVANVNDAPTGSVTISGTPAQGQTLTASNTLADLDGLGTISYTWKADGNVVGTGATYTLTQAEVGKAITATASYTDGQGTNEAVASAPTAAVANVNDAPTGSVTISGTPAQGQTLTASNTLADLDGLGTISYTWKADGNVVGTGATYTLTQAEVGKAITATASYTDGQGTNEAVASAPTAAVANVNDAPTGSVTISGTPAQGQTLTASNTLADLDGLGTISYTWKADGNVVGTGATYTLTQAEVGKAITATASYTDGQGTNEAVASAPTAAVANVNDAPTGSVTISGTPAQGQTLTASNTLADLDGLGTISYTWKADGNVVGTGATYTLTQAEVGKAITATASYTDGQGTNEAVASAPTAAVANVNDAPTGSVTISGTPAQGQTLTASNTLADLDGLGTISYTWKADGNVVGTGATYTLTQAEVGKAITATASYTDGQGTNEAVASAPTAAVANVNDAPTGSVTISGTPAQGQTLTASNTLADLDGLGTISYTWKADGNVVGTGATYTLTQAEVGKAITATASYTDGQGTNEAVASAPTAAVANVNDAPTGSVTISGTPAQGQTLTASNTLADLDGLGTISYTWKADGNVVGTGATYTLTQAEVGKAITATASYTDGQGTNEAVASAPTAAVANVNDAPTGSVTISGTPAQGQTLTASNTLADLDGLGTISYTWKADGNVVGTGATYTLTQAEVGKAITATASYTDGQGTNEAVASAPTAAVANVNDAPTGSVTISGTPAQGQTLTASNTLADLDGLGTISYTWKADGNVVGTGATYTLTQAEVGKAITATASYTDGQGTNEAVASAPTAAVANVNDAPTGSVTISGTPAQGQTLTASNTLADLDGLGTISYTWKADGNVVGTGATYTLTQAEVGKAITATASYTDGQGTNEAVASAPTAAVANVNDAPTGSVTISGTPAQGQTLTASNTLADLDGLGTISYTWKADGNVVGTGATYTLTQAEVGKAITATASYTDGQGTNEAVASAPTAAVANVNDAPTGSVTISGTPAQGQTLTASNTLADLDGLGTISYTWKADGNVVGTGATYTLTQAEVGKAITATASYTDGQGTNEAVASAPTAAVANVNDAPTGSVTISGTPAQGQTLTASNTLADLDGLGTISYTWKADGNVVGTGATYTLTQAEVGKAITATASYTDGQGTNEAVASAPTAAVANVNDAPTGSVTISGTPAQGQTLTASNTLADLDGLGTISYTWKADGNVVGTGATYTLTQAEVGKAITATASYTDGQGTNEAVASAPTAAVANVNDAPTGSVTISGTPAQGQTLTASNTLADLDGLGTISYTWKADGNVVGTGATYTLTQAEVGKAITATASYTDGQGTNEAVASAPTAAVANVNDAPTGSVTISGTPAQGQTLTASNTLADLDGLGTISYTWKADGNVVGTGATYTLTQAEVGKAITATASYTDGQGTNEAVASAPTAAVANVNDAPTGSVTISGTPAQGQTLTASNTLADLDGLGTISYTWKADGNVVGTGATYTLTQAEVGKAITATASYTDGQGTNEAVASAPTAAVANVNDAPTGSVTISGTPAQGQTLTASNTLADLDGLGTISYTWKADGNVVGTGATYTLTQAEVGKAITATASYTDGQGTNEAVASAPTAAVANVNDAPTGSVTISGTPAQGQTLTASNTLADLDGLGTISYTWKADGNVVGTGATYTLTQAEVGKAITATASYTDGQGTNEAVASAPTAAVANVNDAPTGSVTISGTPAQGQTLTASNTLADLDGLGTISYTWKADGNVVGTGATYTLTQAEVGKAITATASYTDGQGTNEAVASAPTAAVANVNDAPTGSVTISGTPAQGQTLTASNTLADLDGLGTISYTWKADGNVVGTGATYTLTQAEVGKAITATASYTDGQGTNEAVASAPTAAVANVNDAPTGSVTISGTPAQGQTLTASNTLADLDGLGTISYTWKADGNVVGTGATYTLTQAEVGKAITATASYTDGQGTNEAVASAPTAAVANVNDAPTTNPVTLTPINEDSSTRLITQADLLAHAHDVEGDALAASGLTIASGNGALVANGNGTWAYTPALNDNGSVSFSYTVSDGNGGIAIGRANLVITPVDDPIIITGIKSGVVTNISVSEFIGLLIISDVDHSEAKVAFLDVTPTLSHSGYGFFSMADGIWRYELITDNASVKSLKPGETLTDSYSFKASNGVVQAVTVIINGTNTGDTNKFDPPYVISDPVNKDNQDKNSPNTNVGSGIVTDVTTTNILPTKINDKNNVYTLTGNSFVVNELQKTTTHGNTLHLSRLDESADNDLYDSPYQDRHLMVSTHETSTLNLEHKKHNVESSDIEFWDHINKIKQQLNDGNSSQSDNSVEVEIMFATTFGLTAGFVSWLLRGGSLLASIMSTVPLLNKFDPVPILRSSKKTIGIVGKKSDPEDEDDSNALEPELLTQTDEARENEID